MIKVNLLNSVTDRASGSTTIVSVVEKKIVNPQSQMMVVLVAVFALSSLAMLFTYWITSSNRARAEAELVEQQQVAQEMKAILKEQAELEAQTKAIEARIEAIKMLRSNQQGPVAVLSAINERIPVLNDFKLQGIEQKAGDISITGDSPNEMAVTQFGRSLEFSSGLFTNVSIELQRKAMDNITYNGDASGNSYKPETVSFTIKCRYTPPAATPPSTAPTQVNPAAPVAAASAASASASTQVQVAVNN